MRSILFLIVAFFVGYFVLWGGTTRTLYNADINPRILFANLASGVDEDFVPEMDSARGGFKFTNDNSYKTIKDNIFMTYDPDVCLSLIDMVYSSGASGAEALIAEYNQMFTLPEDTDKLLNILKSYKDKQTLDILLNMYKAEAIDKAKVLEALSAYHTPEVAKAIHESTTDYNPDLVEFAKNLENSFSDKKWYTEGLQSQGINYNPGVTPTLKKDYEGQVINY